LLENYLLPFQFSQLPLLQVVPQNTPKEWGSGRQKIPSPPPFLQNFALQPIWNYHKAMEDRASLYEICRNSLGTKKRMESWASWLISGKWKTGQTFSRMLMVRSLLDLQKSGTGQVAFSLRI
jgi:hypothetical protein